tara:strand:+ start:5734 stop:6666 length:933 start_codon:yes stop_codon:yes gene_type:complete
MIDITIENNLELYQNYKKSLDFLSNIDEDQYTYPKEITYFHVYSEIKTEKELLCIESYIATQDREKTKLILWSDYDITDNDLIKPYKDFIDMRVYDFNEESKGTILEGNKVLENANDTKHYMKSGILRFLVTYKYGGVWLDMDMVLLRNFKPILDQEWAYMWGGETDFYNFGPCAAIMNLKKESEHAKICLEEMVKTNIIPDSTVLDHMLLAKVYSRRQFTVFPSTFFNTEWQMNISWDGNKKIYDSSGIGTKTESGWFIKNEYSESLFEDAFSWHWHNSSYKNHKVQEGSKFNLLQNKIKNNLKNKGII